MKRSSFVLSAIILTLGGFFAKAIGALYKIPLTNILGSNGMGVYYLVFPLYSLVIAFCSSGISVALSTEVAKCRKIHHRFNEQKLLRVALVFTFVISLILSLAIVFLSSTLAEIQGNMNAKLGYIAISPAIILSSLIATIRGYFQGIENMVPTTVSMIIEQIVKLSVGLVLAHKLCVYGLEYAVLGAILGVTISEIVALIIIVINFITYKGQLYYNYRNKFFKNKTKKFVSKSLKKKKLLNVSKNCKKSLFIANAQNIRYSTRSALAKLLAIAIPCTLSNILIPISTMLDSFMIINLMVKSGYSLAISTSLYGLWGGVIQALISLPTIIVSAISTSLVPALSGIVARNDTSEIKNKIAFYIKLTLVLSLIMFVIFYVFAEDMLKFLYGDGLSDSVIDEMFYAVKMLKISSISIVYYAFLQTFTAILQTIGKSTIPFYSLLFGLCIRTLLIVCMVSNISINIFGVVISNIIFLSIADVILAISIAKKIRFEYKLYNHLLKPMIISIVILLVCQVIKYAFGSIINYFILALIVGIFGVFLYLLWIYFGKIFTPKELEQFKIGKKKISHK